MGLNLSKIKIPTKNRSKWKIWRTPYYCSISVSLVFIYKVATRCHDNFPNFSATSFWSCATLVLITVFIHYFHLTFLFLNCMQMFQWSSGYPSIIGRHKTHIPQNFKEKICVSFFVARLRIKFAQNKNPLPSKKGPERNIIYFLPFSPRTKISGLKSHLISYQQKQIPFTTILCPRRFFLIQLRYLPQIYCSVSLRLIIFNVLHDLKTNTLKWKFLIYFEMPQKWKIIISYNFMPKTKQIDQKLAVIDT